MTVFKNYILFIYIMLFKNRYAITFGETAVLHVGGQKHGAQQCNEGFSTTELEDIHQKMAEYSEIIWINDKLPYQLQDNNKACILVIRQNSKLISKVYADQLYNEQEGIAYDTKYWDSRRNRTLNKRARLNIVFGNENISCSDDFKQCTVRSFFDLEHLRNCRDILPLNFGTKADHLCAEGNHYHHDKSNIGFHGDTERKIVICLSLGRSSTLQFHWRTPHSSDHLFEPINVKLHHGDIYIMSEKATGNDWRQRSNVRVVHSAYND